MDYTTVIQQLAIQQFLQQIDREKKKYFLSNFTFLKNFACKLIYTFSDFLLLQTRSTEVNKQIFNRKYYD